MRRLNGELIALALNLHAHPVLSSHLVTFFIQSAGCLMVGLDRSRNPAVNETHRLPVNKDPIQNVSWLTRTISIFILDGNRRVGKTVLRPAMVGTGHVK